MTGVAIFLAVACFAGLFGHACEFDRARGRPIDEDSAGWFAIIATASVAASGYCAEALVRWGP